MAGNGTNKSRSNRVAGLGLPQGRWLQISSHLRDSKTIIRLALLVVVAAALWAVVQGWANPFPYRTGQVPQRDIVARVSFDKANPDETRFAKQTARRREPLVYRNDPEPLIQLRSALINQILAVSGAASLAELDPEVWSDFDPPPADEPRTEEQREERFQQFRAALSGQEALDELELAVERALAPFVERGLLEQLPPEQLEGNQDEITVYTAEAHATAPAIKLADVLIGDGRAVQVAVHREVSNSVVANRIFDWLQPRLTTTLRYDPDATERARERAAASVPQQFVTVAAGETLAAAGQPLGDEELANLRLEYDRVRANRSTMYRVARGTAVLCVIAGLYVLCGHFLLRRAHHVWVQLTQFTLLLGCTLTAVALSCWLSTDPWRAELLPLLFISMTFAIAYGREVAFILAAAIAVLVTIAIDQTLGTFVVLFGCSATASLLLGRIRSRSKLIEIGLATAAAAALLTLVVDTLQGQPLAPALWQHVGFNALWAFVAALLMSAMLSIIEYVFGVVTDLTLLEYGDVSRSLLQELVRRAPGTYNHSINVASIAEAAAEAIGANGLLVRVGAYYHDIGKIFKPEYFAENQGEGASRHESLVPAMSTLIIIAHVKDGADLARQHHLPQPIVDFILQHHGTTLVEYFFARANQQNEADPEGTHVEESAFRYPGPKPQTVEAGIMMLADAVESACRALGETTPARIEGLVHDLAMKRLLDGQFDACGLDLRQLRIVEQSLIKSLIAVYHGRVKYPDATQRTA